MFQDEAFLRGDSAITELREGRANTAPRELPGLYWDAKKQRYFPLSSKPKGAIQAPATKEERRMRAIPAEGAPQRKRRRVKDMDGTWVPTAKLRTAYTSAQRSRAMHDIQASNIASTSRGCSHYVSGAPVTAFCVDVDSSQDDESYSVLAGDSHGWLYSLNGSSEPMTHAVDLNVASRASISSVCSSGARHIATSFGSPCKIVVRENKSTETWTILTLPDRVCHDVRTSHLADRSLALGAAKKAIYLPDIETGRGFSILDTGSDVLSVQQQDHLIYTGARNGQVSRFDTRLDERNCQVLLDGKFEQTTSSITHLNIIHQWELLVATVSGDLETHDLRFLHSAVPLMQFKGHHNTFKLDLGIAVDPSENYLFAGGQDLRIRGWSLRTGNQLKPSAWSLRDSDPSTTSSPLDRTFDSPVRALQVTENSKELCLWAASDGVLNQYFLGQRSELS